ncbi:MAG: carboxymuconolactone decarboxylase family protein [Isosphaeraceae bacterium]
MTSNPSQVIVTTEDFSFHSVHGLPVHHRDFPEELIALGIGLAQRRTPCISLHVQGCLKAGASREQILEAAGLAVVMQGGPAFTHVP